MPRCETCNWWGNPKGERDFPGASGEVPGLIYPKSHRVCAQAFVSMFGRNAKVKRSSIVLTFDSVGLTGPKFGCVHHEAKT